MGIWIRAICTKSIGPLKDIDLKAALADADFALWAEGADLDEEDGDAAERALRFEYPKHRSQEYGLLRYRDDDHFIRFDRWTGEAAREEADELAEMVDAEGAAADRVREVLARAVETVGFELKSSDAQGMGWPIALAAAMFIAERGQGLVQGDTDGDTWWDPATGAVVVEY